MTSNLSVIIPWKPLHYILPCLLCLDFYLLFSLSISRSPEAYFSIRSKVELLIESDKCQNSFLPKRKMRKVPECLIKASEINCHIKKKDPLFSQFQPLNTLSYFSSYISLSIFFPQIIFNLKLCQGAYVFINSKSKHIIPWGLSI